MNKEKKSEIVRKRDEIYYQEKRCPRRSLLEQTLNFEL